MLGWVRCDPGHSFFFFRVLGISNAWEIAEISTLRLLADDTGIYRSHNHLLAG